MVYSQNQLNDPRVLNGLQFLDRKRLFFPGRFKLDAKSHQTC